MPGKRPRPFISTSIRPPAGPSRGYEIPPASPEAVKYCLGVPQRVVVGFDVGENGIKESSSKCYVQSCRSPRSVLETDALSDQEHPPARSLRSVLDRLLSRPASQPLSKAAISSSSKPAISSGSVAGIRGEEPVSNAFELDIVVEEKDMAVSGKIVAASKQDGFFSKDLLTSTPNPSVCDNILKNFASSPEELEVQQDEHAVAVVQASIFCAGSPFSHYHSQLSVGDFLSVCFLCKCSLMPGKDIFMYRGDRAFCSSECRYQQIVIDELKERQPISGNCFPEPPVQDSGLLNTTAPRCWF